LPKRWRKKRWTFAVSLAFMDYAFCFDLIPLAESVSGNINKNIFWISAEYIRLSSLLD